MFIKGLSVGQKIRYVEYLLLGSYFPFLIFLKLPVSKYDLVVIFWAGVLLLNIWVESRESSR